MVVLAISQKLHRKTEDGHYKGQCMARREAVIHMS